MVCCAPCKHVCYGTVGETWRGTYKERVNCLNLKSLALLIQPLLLLGIESPCRSVYCRPAPNSDIGWLLGSRWFLQLCVVHCCLLVGFCLGFFILFFMETFSLFQSAWTSDVVSTKALTLVQSHMYLWIYLPVHVVLYWKKSSILNDQA